MELKELIKKIGEDGKVDAAEAAQLREVVYADGQIDREEAEELFALNDQVSGADNDPSWGELFVGAIVKHILSDGDVDEEETEWLKARIGADGQIDELEKEILRKIREKAEVTCDGFDGWTQELGI